MNFKKEFDTKEVLNIDSLALKTNRILELDGLRAFAVLLVVFYHMAYWAKSIPFINQTNEILPLIGEEGVHIFFVISGFIITFLLIKEYEVTGKISLVSFYQRRFFRIIPPLLAYLSAICILYTLGVITTNYTNLIWSILFLGNLHLFEGGMSSYWFFGHTWSLAVEEQYYLIFPLIMVWLLSFRKMRAITVLSIILFCFSIGVNRIALAASEHISPEWIKLSAFNQFRYIIAGVLLALHKDKIEQMVKNTSLFIPSLLIAVVITTYYVSEYKLLFYSLHTIISFIYALLIMWFISNPEKCSILRWKVIQWIGRCSYSIYLWQQLFTGDARFYNTRSIAQSPILATIAILSCAAISYYFIEIPCVRFGRRFSKPNVLSR
jgi:peptidoglycan/LPS O-acetylase OafA/YrhL